MLGAPFGSASYERAAILGVRAEAAERELFEMPTRAELDARASEDVAGAEPDAHAELASELERFGDPVVDAVLRSVGAFDLDFEKSHVGGE